MKYTVFCLLLLPYISPGQKADTPHMLQEIVVTGSRTERPVSQSPGSINIVHHVLLRNAPANRIEDILVMLSGVNT
ncbi:MAG: TonB-dependent receptor, partial [Odoribacter sp.]|nr:TonB-dependent receptor [Odoribacter sp.]